MGDKSPKNKAKDQKRKQDDATEAARKAKEVKDSKAKDSKK